MSLLTLASLATLACDGASPVTRVDHAVLVDVDGDGRVDAMDANGDGAADITFGSASMCARALVDSDADGVVDGLDLDCDGSRDIRWCAGAITGDGLDLDCDGTGDVALARLVPEAGCAPEWQTDSVGRPVGIDTSCDGIVDVRFPTGGCVPALLDTDADGWADAVDVDCDGSPKAVTPCLPSATDTDGDQRLDAVDLDCDQTVDFTL